MATNVGYVIKVEKLRPHTNADRLQILEVFGTAVTVGLDVKVSDIGIYFPTGLQLSEEYCKVNDLVRRKDENGNPAGGYLDPEKRNIVALKLRGERSDGLFMPLSSLSSFGDIDILNIGDTIFQFNGHEICDKYIPRTNPSRARAGKEGSLRKKKNAVAPLFAEHVDTEQLAYNLNAFKPGDVIEISLKMHGSSQRTGHLPVLKGYKRSLLDKLFKREGKPIYDWGYVSGTRRTILDDFEGGFYGSNAFREQHSKNLEGKLLKGETCYYEVVGFIDSGAPIMPSADNKKTNDKEFIKLYGKTTVFSYGCEPNGKRVILGSDESGTFTAEIEAPQSDMYVYRMTMTNEDGDVVEYTPEFMRYRCEQMGVKSAPSFGAFVIPHDSTEPGEWVKNIAELYYDGPDLIDKRHVREGVVVRNVSRPKFAAYKHKNFNFKVLSGIAIAQAEASGIDAADDILGEM